MACAQQPDPGRLEPVMELSLGPEIGQLRAVPVSMGEGRQPAVLAAWSADFDVDPYVEMFFFPSDTLKLTLFTVGGEVLWQRDLGPGVVPGLWFCPVFAFDLDGDGADEIWFVNNVNIEHPLGLSGYRLERLNPVTGETTGRWPWPRVRRQSLSHTFRNFILGGRARGEPVLVTAQGTYADMHLQGWDKGIEERWRLDIAAEEPGARGSHMCAVVDLDGDGSDDLMWGERCVELDTGRQRFCCDRETWAAHSDVVQPLLDRSSGKWFIYTCREGAGPAPRVALYDDAGERVWGHLQEGHVDMGWVARLKDDGGHVAMATRIGHKAAGPSGRFRSGCEEFTWDALTGEEWPCEFSTYGTIPVDLNGDGLHELVRGRAGCDGEVLDRHGEPIRKLGGAVAMACKFLERPGEQLLTYHGDGTVRLWAAPNAEDSQHALARYSRPFYRANRRLTATGYNLHNLGGI